jgi:substrate-binding family protein
VSRSGWSAQADSSWASRRRAAGTLRGRGDVGGGGQRGGGRRRGGRGRGGRSGAAGAHALGARLAISEAGLRVPQDISLMGYDDEPELAAETTPPLSTVRLPYEEMGRWAVEQLLSGAHTAVAEQTLLPCALVARSSVGPPPA